MKKLDKYIIKQFLISLSGSLVFMLGLYVIMIYLDNLRYFSHANVSILLILKYIINIIPEILIQVLPAAALFSTSYTFGNMNSTNEIIAVYNGRVGFARLLSPLFIAGLLIAGLSFLFFEFVSADSSRRAFEIRNDIKKLTGKSLGYMYSNFDYFLRGRDGVIYYVRKFDSDTGIMHDPVIVKFDRKGNMVFQLIARSGAYHNADDMWSFKRVHIIHYDGNEEYSEEDMDSHSMKLAVTPEDFVKTPENVLQMRMKEAKDFIRDKKNSGANYKRYLVEYYWRFAFPFSSVITILIGGVAGIYFRKAVLVLSFFLSIILSFGYYGIMALGMAYGKSGKLDPVVAAWAGNAVYLAASIIAIRLKK